MNTITLTDDEYDALRTLLVTHEKNLAAAQNRYSGEHYNKPVREALATARVLLTAIPKREVAK